MRGRPWTPEEESFVEENWGVMHGRLIAEHLGRSFASVQNKQQKLAHPDQPSSGDPWTDEELGFVQDHDDWTSRRIGRSLGRSSSTVEHMRKAIRDGWSREREKWTEEEDALLLATPSLTVVQVARYLGNRTPNAVNHRRALLRAVHGVRFDEFTKDPAHVGRRPLIAKTCHHCGLILAATWFYATRTGWTNFCVPCHITRGIETARARGDEYQNAYRSQRQALTLRNATRKGEPWLDADHEILADPDLTITEKALSLGRTYAATSSALSLNGYTSRRPLGDPERDQWIIENPNRPRIAS